ncbi:MAG: phosphoribosyltransferase [Candidatus Methanoplasma sp.]|jgi:hypothetical protein|nr:phosphoribosyltransferase [Candidatus Methanoplasma sp.]
MKELKESIPKCSDVAPSVEEVVNPITQIIARCEIQDFLRKTLDDVKPDAIVSTLRKGYWIIEDFIRAYGLEESLVHVTTDGVDDGILEGKSILIFDDSIHTGNGIEGTVKKAVELSKKPVHVACITINREAYDKIQSLGHVDIIHLKIFDEYLKFNKNEFLPGCQAYYYFHYMVPYISTLSVNDSPDFCGLRLRIEGSSVDKLSPMMDCILNSLKHLTSSDGDHNRDSYIGTKRVSVDLDWDKVSDHMEAFEKDIAKVRISASVRPNCSELVLTPMICPRCSDGDVNNTGVEHLLFTTSEDFINRNANVVQKELEAHGFHVISSDLIHTAPKRGC